MLTELLIFFSVATALTALLVLVPGFVRVRAFVSLPLAIISLAAAGYTAAALTNDWTTATILPVGTLGAIVLVRVAVLRRWSILATQLQTTFVLAGLAFIAYAVMQTIAFAFNPVWMFFSAVLLFFEVMALLLAASYAFEMLDVMGRRHQPPESAEVDPEEAAAEGAGYTPLVAIQVPAYNEPVEVVQVTLESLARIDYPNYIVQVVDNNTEDPNVWRPLEQLCQQLGPKFQFMHLEDWPGFKAGALNEATKRLPAEVEILAIVDADYVVEPGFLKATVPPFADPNIAFVQSPQNYRDWDDSKYLRGLYYSYRYFFDLTMRARANRNSIIFAGTMGLLRRSALLEVGGWSEECVTEDAEASLRILGRGYSGAYVPQAWGSGLMPLDFDGLKKQRYRWSLGGIQILKEHWRELIPGIPHRMKLTFAQRMHYLFGSLQWFGDPLTAGFTILLAGTALGIAARHRLPVRQLTGPAMVVPMIFLATGLLRALWALKVTTKSTWGDALRALRIWFALSWVVTMACIAGLFRSEAVFLRTPKRKDGKLSVLQALRSSWIETGFVALTLISGALMLLVEPTFAFAALAAMLLFEAFVYGSAPWASLAAEGIILTPLREAQKRSAQNTGMRPALRRAAAVPAGIAAAAATAVMASVVVVAPTGAPPSTHDLPTFGQVVGAAPNNPVTPVLEVSPSVPIGLPVQNVDATPVPSASASVAPSALPSASASPSTVPSAAPSPPPSPVPSASAQPLP